MRCTVFLCFPLKGAIKFTQVGLHINKVLKFFDYDLHELAK